MNSTQSKRQMPDAFVILFFVIIIAALLTYIVTPGYFIPSLDSNQSITVDAFRYAESHSGGVKLFDGSAEQVGIVNYAFEGLVSGDKWGSAVGVVAFILVVGGAFGIVMQTGAVNNGIIALVSRTQHAGNVILPLMFILFSFGGAVFGMGEEAIAFCIVLVPLIVGLGYDAITAVLITYVATQIGFATSWMNPFSVAIAQGIADVPLLSGQYFRMITWAAFTAGGLFFTLRYAKGIKQSPKSSACFDSDQHFRQQQSAITADYSLVDTLVLLSLLAGIAWVIWGVSVHQYYIPQIASQFFAMGLLISTIVVVSKRMTMNQCSSAFVKGAQELLPAALIVGMAKGIILILGGDDVHSPSTLNTLLYYASSTIGEAGATVSALAMYGFQCIFNFFVASGSGQAAITMPLMAPLSDLVGVSRQVAVLAFQLGDGLTNLIIPTSASLIGCLGVARLDWSVWAKVMWRFIAALIGMGAITVVIAVFIGLN